MAAPTIASRGIDPNKQHGLVPPAVDTPEWDKMIRTAVYVVAGEMREAGADPALVSGDDAWAFYSRRVLNSLYENGYRDHMIPGEFLAYLRHGSYGSVAFRRAWLALREAGSGDSLEALAREKPGNWHGPVIK